MGSYDNIVKIEEMRRKMDDGDALSAQKILDTMDLKKIKNMLDLSLAAEVYDINERYEEAAQLYLKIYEKTKSRKSLFQLTDISIKRNNIEDAQYYLTQYQKVAPRDFYRYVFRYKIDKLKGEPYDQLIDTLVTLKETEYTEQWAYELAKNYYKAGMEAECIQECSDIVLWFGEGSYVEKAKMLRAYYSGEADKERIMEELKRRASQNDNQEETEEQDERVPSQDYEIQEEVGYLEDESDYESPSNAVMDSTDWEEAAYARADLSSEEEVSLSEEALEENFYSPKEQEEKLFETDSQLEEQEVEEAIYHLLQEEDVEEEGGPEEDVQEEDRKLRRLSDELQFCAEEIFGDFLQVKLIKRQLVQSLEYILEENTKTVYLVITGNIGSGKTTLAKDITLFLNKSGKLKSSKIAKIKADKLNTIDVMSKKETLKDCCVVVENASELKRRTIDNLLELSQSLQGYIALVLEDNEKDMEKLFQEYPKLTDLFENRIHLS
jgi:tRNA A37 threonylcarbamoyladenosine biosynthesis protein TsaE